MIAKYYEGTSKIINYSTEIGKYLGLIDGANLRKPKTELRKQNKIKTIYSSLAIEGNTLSIDQITAILENRRVIGPSKDILEVKNAINVYESLKKYKANDEKSYLRAHKDLMEGLIANPGKYRTEQIGIIKGQQITHLAPPAWNVDNLMKGLFNYLKKGEDNHLIKSCVFHYEMEFIHPFMDGNGRLGRLWQSVTLMGENPVFEYLPIELEIKNNQKEYYEVLSICDKEGMSTRFIEFMLERISNSLESLIGEQRKTLNEKERIEYFCEQFDKEEFSRKDYMKMFKTISGATASRDLKKGLDMDMYDKFGELRKTTYKLKNRH